ncbi:fumarylpyruvate hydrolase [Cognatiyoonia koreensis]|uniref:Fumarylpyruvate hydrolase n=1 Tax=Cognatiyoonia koreensis TaxID=364200 RepID=A0A1I0QJV3_9RHOB|nr:fumarylacetoacetate hydrolase family protein [Cognatiyoonia koreensis]SEW27402.1 fumarylpyruvate hydrolase [Cognatiyoonia koreensis]
MTFVFPPSETKSLPVEASEQRYAVRRIFCVGRNYAAHAAEMGGEVDREAPWYFTKSSEALAASGQTLPYPPGTSNYHYEMELVVALGATLFKAAQVQAADAVFGYACGLDMTRRDLQQVGKDNRRPWDLGKDVENGAVIGALSPSVAPDAHISLTVNDETRQDATLADMVWSVPEILSHLSHYYHLGPGDLVMTGTPAGVGPVVAGDRIKGMIDGLEPVKLTLGDPET